VRSRRYRKAVAGKVAPALLDKGFNGLFLDNTDMIENHHGQAKGMRTLVRSLSGLARSRGKLLFAQNGYDVIGPLIPYLDGWNREDVTWTWDLDRHRYVHQHPDEIAGALGELRSLAGDGLLVTATDYVSAGDAGASAEAVSNACSAGALPYVSDIGLRRVPAAPAICP
jgi:polysaccharide biosynthesis protein PelA